MRPGTFLFLLVLAAGAPGDGAAQTPADTTPTEREASRPPYVAPRVAFSVTFGTLGFTELHVQRVLVERLGKNGVVLDAEGSLRRNVSAEEGRQLGASALLGLSPTWALRVGASLGSAALADGYTGDEPLRADVAALPHPVSRDLTIVSLEGALRFRIRSRRPFQPYMELGLAAVRMEAESAAYPGAASMDGGSTVAGLAGVGAVVPAWGALAGRIQLSGHFFRTPLSAAPVGAPVVEGTRLRVTFEAPQASAFADPMPELTRTLRLDLGIAIELGAADRRPDATAAPTSGSRR